MKKFNILDKNNIFDFYQSNGYVVIKQAIKNSKIDNFIKSYESIRRNPLFVYYSQSTHVAIRPKLNKYSYIKESMQNASRLAFFKDFSKTFQACIYDENIANT